jgi:hypothetical protein
MRNGLLRRRSVPPILGLVVLLGGGASGAHAGIPVSPKQELIQVKLAVVVVQQAQLPQLRQIASCSGPRKVACVRAAARRLATVSGQGVALLQRVRSAVRFACARDGAAAFAQGTQMYRTASLRLAGHGQRLRAKGPLLRAEEQQGRGVRRLNACPPSG